MTEPACALHRVFVRPGANRFQLFVLAAGIRNKYLNKKTAEYSDEFREWYEKHSLAKLFGKLPNFTKYASAGDVVAYVAKRPAIREGKGGETATDERGLTVGEIAFLDDVWRDLMGRKRNKRGYLVRLR